MSTIVLANEHDHDVMPFKIICMVAKFLVKYKTTILIFLGIMCRQCTNDWGGGGKTP